MVPSRYGIVSWLNEHEVPTITAELIQGASKARLSGSKPDVFQVGLSNQDPLVHQSDHDIPPRDGTTRIRIYRPRPADRNTPSPGPLIVMYHPGGFCFGDYTMMDSQVQSLCKQFDATCLSVDYRLAPESQFPAAAHDAWDSMEWAAANSTGPLLNADPSKGFIVSGVSAGGTLAGVVSHLARDEQMTPPLSGVHLSIPGLAQQDGNPERYKDEVLLFNQNEDAPILNLAGVKLLAESYAGEVNSPLHNVLSNPNGHRNLPAHFLQVAGLDPLRDSALVYERELREECGISTKMDVYAGYPHAFWLFAREMPITAKYHEDLMAGFEWLLGRNRKGIQQN